MQLILMLRQNQLEGGSGMVVNGHLRNRDFASTYVISEALRVKLTEIAGNHNKN